ncbi:MAG TPA: sulfite exporter TauE/SafE family protein [Nocardioidaceae bacterium]
MGVVLPLLAAVVGVLIGMVGVGGVLLPPGLVAAGGLDPHEATATSTWVFIFTGVVGTVAYAWRGMVPWGMLARLAVGVLPAAFLGARANAVLPGDVVLLAMAALTLFVGVHQLWPRAGRSTDTELGTVALVGIGAAVGFGSTLTGTGGPVLLVPILLALGVAPVLSVAVSQAVQLPVVLSGSVGYLQAGLVDVRLGSVLGLTAALGTLGGAVVATRLHADGLRTIVAGACIVAGVFLLLRLVPSYI